RAFLSAAAGVWEYGHTVRWEGLETDAEEHARLVWLPEYPFRRERHWIEPANAPSAAIEERTPAAASDEEPESDLTQAVAAIFEKVLGHKTIARRRTFF